MRYENNEFRIPVADCEEVSVCVHDLSHYYNRCHVAVEKLKIYYIQECHQHRIYQMNYLLILISPHRTMDRKQNHPTRTNILFQKRAMKSIYWLQWCYAQTVLTEANGRKCNQKDLKWSALPKLHLLLLWQYIFRWKHCLLAAWCSLWQAW